MAHSNTKYNFMRNPESNMDWSQKHKQEILDKLRESNRFTLISDEQSPGQGSSDGIRFVARSYRIPLGSDSDQMNAKWYIWVSNDERREILKQHRKN